MPPVDLRICALAFAILPLVLPAAAQDKSSQGSEQQSLTPESLGQAMAALLSATIARDLKGTLSFVAPRKIDKFAQSQGLTRAEALQDLVRTGRKSDAQSGVSVLSGSYDLNGAVFGTTPAGRSYALIPYSRRFAKDGSTFDLTVPTLVSLDGGQIFITPLSDDSLLAEMVALYPDLAVVQPR